MVRTTFVTALAGALLAQQASATWWLPTWGTSVQTTTQQTTTSNAYLGCYAYTPVLGGPSKYVASEAACDTFCSDWSYMYYTVQWNGAKQCQCAAAPIGVLQSPAASGSTCATGDSAGYKRDADYTFADVCTDRPSTLGYKTVYNVLAVTADQCFRTCSAGNFEYALYNPRPGLLTDVHCICASGYKAGQTNRCDASTYYVYGLGGRSEPSSASQTLIATATSSATTTAFQTSATSETTPAPRPPPTTPTQDDEINAPAPSGLRRRRDVRPKSANEIYCMKGLTACVIPGTLDWECVDPQNDIQSCGGCAFGNFGGDTASMGVDCSSLPGVKSTGVHCSSGQCIVTACRTGHSLADGHCVPSQ